MNILARVLVSGMAVFLLFAVVAAISVAALPVLLMVGAILFLLGAL